MSETKTLHIEEESAIIPLKRLNQYKYLEDLLLRLLRDEEKFVKVESLWWGPRAGAPYVTFYAATPWDVERSEIETLRYKLASLTKHIEESNDWKVRTAQEGELKAVQKMNSVVARLEKAIGPWWYRALKGIKI